METGMQIIKMKLAVYSRGMKCLTTKLTGGQS